MKAITIRQNGKLIAFGPYGGGYDPGVPSNATRAIEDDYIAIMAEYQKTLPPAKTADELFIDQLIQAISNNPTLKNKLKSALV